MIFLDLDADMTWVMNISYTTRLETTRTSHKSLTDKPYQAIVSPSYKQNRAEEVHRITTTRLAVGIAVTVW